MRHLLVIFLSVIKLCDPLKIRENTNQCENLNLLQRLDPPGPKTVLASVPGSGNTWVRHLLQLATGIFTGSEYQETAKSFAGGGFLQNGSAIVIKNHFFKSNR